MKISLLITMKQGYKTDKIEKMIMEE